MKKSFVIILFVALAAVVYGFEAVPVKYHNVPYGSTPDEVNELLQATNFISAAVEPEVGTFYQHLYADPDIVWYNTESLRWINVSFTTNTIDTLFMRDNKIEYVSTTIPNEFKRMTIRGDNLVENVNGPVGQATKWVYRFYFHNDALFAVSVRYEGESTLEQYKERNEGNDNANPGYVMANDLFRRNLDLIGRRYGGFQYKRAKTLDKYTSLTYGGYALSPANLSMSVYYATYYNTYINMTMSYVDNYRFTPVVKRFQNQSYEVYPGDRDMPVGFLEFYK